MLVKSRIRIAWNQLRETLQTTVPGSSAWVLATQRWLRDVAPAVAPPAARILADSPAVRLFLATSPETAPASLKAVQALQAATAADEVSGPEHFASQLSHLVGALAVFHDPEHACDLCQYTLELWQQDVTPIWACGLSHAWSVDFAKWSGDLALLFPAPRATVIAVGRGQFLAMPPLAEPSDG